jgi:serine/threonine protein kinase
MSYNINNKRNRDDNTPPSMPNIKQNRIDDNTEPTEIIPPTPTEVLEPTEIIPPTPTEVLEPTEIIPQTPTEILEPTEIIPPQQQAQATPQPTSQTPLQSNNGPRLLAQGTYGCVYVPPIKCADTKPAGYYNNKISKLMTTNDALVEMNEYNTIAAADPSANFYLGIPETCTPVANYMSYAENCRAMHKPRAANDTAKLLIMKNGGDNISIYVKNILDRINNLTKSGVSKRAIIEQITPDIDYLILAMYKLLFGIRMLGKNDLIHHDIKPGNIVYDEHTHNANLIDFGIMEKHSRLLANINTPANRMRPYWWSYPWEFDHNRFNEFKQLLKNIVASGATDPSLNVSLITDANASPVLKQLYIKNSPLHIDYFTIAHNVDPTALQDILHLQNTFYKPELKQYYTRLIGAIHVPAINVDLNNLDSPENDQKLEVIYKHLISRSLSQVDLYGFGLTLMFILSRLHAVIHPRLYKDLCGMVDRIISPNPFNRAPIEFILFRFRQILTDPADGELLNKYPDFNATYGTIINSPRTLAEISNVARPLIERARAALAAQQAAQKGGMRRRRTKHLGRRKMRRMRTHRRRHR